MFLYKPDSRDNADKRQIDCEGPVGYAGVECVIRAHEMAVSLLSGHPLPDLVLVHMTTSLSKAKNLINSYLYDWFDFQKTIILALRPEWLLYVQLSTAFSEFANPKSCGGCIPAVPQKSRNFSVAMLPIICSLFLPCAVKTDALPYLPLAMHGGILLQDLCL